MGLRKIVFFVQKANVQLHLVINALLRWCLHLRYNNKAELCLVVKIFWLNEAWFVSTARGRFQSCISLRSSLCVTWPSPIPFLCLICSQYFKTSQSELVSRFYVFTKSFLSLGKETQMFLLLFLPEMSRRRVHYGLVISSIHCLFLHSSHSPATLQDFSVVS